MLFRSGYNYSQFQSDNILLTYPNPFENYLQIAFYSVDSQMISVQLFDIRGRKVADQTLQANVRSVNYITLNSLEEIDRGMYILRINTSTKTYYKKLIR